MALQLDLRALSLATLGSGSISGTYAAIGNPFPSPVRVMIVQNLTDVTLTFSFTGNTDHFVLPTGGQLILDVASDEFQGNGFIISINTQMYVKGSPTTGSAYISAFYAKGT